MAEQEELLTDAKANKLALKDLGAPHQLIALTAISNVLSTEIAHITFAQIVDGLPLADTLWESDGIYVQDSKHPIYEHKELRPGVLDRLTALCSQFDHVDLTIDAKVHTSINQF